MYSPPTVVKYCVQSLTIKNFSDIIVSNIMHSFHLLSSSCSLMGKAVYAIEKKKTWWYDIPFLKSWMKNTRTHTLFLRLPNLLERGNPLNIVSLWCEGHGFQTKKCRKVWISFSLASLILSTCHVLCATSQAKLFMLVKEAHPYNLSFPRSQKWQTHTQIKYYCIKLRVHFNKYRPWFKKLTHTESLKWLLQGPGHVINSRRNAQ